MKLELTNAKAWKKLEQKNIPISDKVSIYEKIGGAYRLGESGGEQVFNKLTELLKHIVAEKYKAKLNEEDYQLKVGQSISLSKYGEDLGKYTVKSLTNNELVLLSQNGKELTLKHNNQKYTRHCLNNTVWIYCWDSSSRIF